MRGECGYGFPPRLERTGPDAPSAGRTNSCLGFTEKCLRTKQESRQTSKQRFLRYSRGLFREREDLAINFANSSSPRLCKEIPVTRHREQRPAVPVHVVLEVKHFGKTGPGGLVLGPGTVRVLRPNKVLNPALQGRSMRIV